MKVELYHHITENIGPREPVTGALTLIAKQNLDLLCVFNLCSDIELQEKYPRLKISNSPKN